MKNQSIEAIILAISEKYYEGISNEDRLLFIEKSKAHLTERGYSLNKACIDKELWSNVSTPLQWSDDDNIYYNGVKVKPHFWQFFPSYL